jgi:hypothetical protein
MILQFAEMAPTERIPSHGVQTAQRHPLQPSLDIISALVQAYDVTANGKAGIHSVHAGR